MQKETGVYLILILIMVIISHQNLETPWKKERKKERKTDELFFDWLSEGVET